jgi:hypothetical protein
MRGAFTWIAPAILLLCRAAAGSEPMPTSLPANYFQLPLAFEAQPRGESFVARGAGFAARLAPTAAMLTRPRDTQEGAVTTALRWRLVGANAVAQGTGAEPLPGVSNYYIGNDPAQWRTRVPNYASVRYANVYPGVDVVYYGTQRELEYDFIVAPGADPKSIVLEFDAPAKPRIDAAGNLRLVGVADDLIQRRPVIYQDSAGVRRGVSGHYVRRGDARIGFAIGPHDHTQPLIIDPVLVYSTYLGGSGDDTGVSIAVDSNSEIFVTGHTSSIDFPVTLGAQQPSLAGTSDVFVSKLNATGTALIYSTYLGGSGGDAGQAIAIDGTGNAYVTGNTSSSDFPTTAGVAQPSFGGVNDAFVTRLNAAGALDYSTYLGGSGLDIGTGIAVDSNGAAYITGYTQSADFPTSVGAYQTAYGGGADDAFVTRLTNTGALDYSTYLGGSGLDIGRAIAVNSNGEAYVTGYTQSANFPSTPGAFQTAFGGGTNDAFIAQLDDVGSGLLYATYLGGSGDDYGMAIAIDGNGDAYVSGSTNSSNFPVTAAAQQPSYAGGVDAFVTALNAAGTAPLYSTYLGGSSYEAGLGIAVDRYGAAFLTGYTQSLNFPTTAGAYKSVHGGGTDDAFVVELNPVGALGYGSYLGASGLDFGYGIAVDATGIAYVVGATYSNDFPLTTGVLQTLYAGGSDAFVAAFPATAFDEIFRDGFE